MSETGRISTARKIPRTINASRGGAARTFRGQNDGLTVAFYGKSRPCTSRFGPSSRSVESLMPSPGVVRLMFADVSLVGSIEWRTNPARHSKTFE
jgi:hypothetical protein